MSSRLLKSDKLATGTFRVSLEGLKTKELLDDTAKLSIDMTDRGSDDPPCIVLHKNENESEENQDGDIEEGVEGVAEENMSKHKCGIYWLFGSLFLTTGILAGTLFGIGHFNKEFVGTFEHSEMPNCYSRGYNLRTLDPALDYVPYFNMNENVECSDYSKTLRERPIAELVQCGLHHYRTGTGNEMVLNWVYGPQHHSDSPPGSAKGGNWKALEHIGKSFYAQSGSMLATFILRDQGTLRDPHWHSNAAEFTFITKGTARITVTGLPRTNAAGSPNTGRHSETFLVGPGDAFYSPVGYHHYFEGVDKNDPLEGIAVFDTADLKTFDTPQMMKSLPVDILGQVLDLPQSEVENMYRGFRRVFVDHHDGWSDENLIDSEVAAESSDNKDTSMYNNMESRSYGDASETNSSVPFLFKISGMDQGLQSSPRTELNGFSQSKAIDKSSHPPLTVSHFSFAYTEIDPGSTIEPYWTDNADEVVYVLEGEGLEVIRSGNGKKDCKDEFTLAEGYVALSEIGSTLTMKNTSKDKKARLLRIFNNNEPSMTTLYDAYYSLPKDVRATMLRAGYYDKYEMFAEG